MHITSIGIDLGKTTFHLVAMGERNKILVRKKFSRAGLLRIRRICPYRSSALRPVLERTSWVPHCGTKDTRFGSSLRSSLNPIGSRTRTIFWMRKLSPKP